MMMTAGTLNGCADKGVHRGGDHVIAIQVPCNLTVHLVFRNLGMPDEVPWPGGDETRSCQPVHALRIEHITCQLFPHKSGIGFVRIK